MSGKGNEMNLNHGQKRNTSGYSILGNPRLRGSSDSTGLIIPEFSPPPMALTECTQTLRSNADLLMREVMSVVDSLRELQKDSTILSGMYSILNDSVIRVSDEGLIIDLNRSAESMFCTSYSSVSKSKISDLLGIPFEELKYHSSSSTPFESRLHKQDNSGYFEASLSVTCIRHLSKEDGNEYIVIVRDVTDIMRMREALSESNVKFEALFKALDEASDVIILTDKNNKILFVNSAFTRYTGYSFSEAVGKNPGFYKSGDLPQSFYDDIWTHLSNRQVWQGTLINKHKFGRTLYDKTIITPVMNGDPVKPAYYIAVKQVGQELSMRQDGRQMQLRLHDASTCDYECD